jgi:bifunctional non-homologous end joining protein LigD
MLTVNTMPYVRSSACNLPQLEDPSYVMQELLVGKRVLIKNTAVTTALDQHGQIFALSNRIIQSADEIGVPFLIDGIIVDNWFYAFDLLSLNFRDCRASPYRDRYDRLYNLIGQGSGAIELLESYGRTAEKSAEYDRLKQTDAEGVVFKRTDAPYTPGEPQLKFTFAATGFFIAAA